VIMSLVQELFDSHFLFSDTVGFKPMQLRQTNRSIVQADCGGTFQFSPMPSPILFPQKGQYPNATPRSYCFNFDNRGDNLKMHHIISYPTCVNKYPPTICSPAGMKSSGISVRCRKLASISCGTFHSRCQFALHQRTGHYSS